MTSSGSTGSTCRRSPSTVEPEADTTFDDSLLVMAKASDPTARLFSSLDGVLWTVGATVTITQDAAVSFIAINASGIASQVVTRSFRKSVRWDDVVTADALQHFLAGRIDATEYVSYSQQFGWFTPFALYLVDGEWVLDPDRPVHLRPPAAVGAVAETAAGARPVLRVTGGPRTRGVRRPGHRGDRSGRRGRAGHGVLHP